MTDRCSICPGTRTCVQGVGPKPSRVMLIGEAPGKNEDERGLPFIGDTGKELDQTYLPLAGLRRSDVRVDNTVRCRPDQNRKPRPNEVSSCSSNHLPRELAETEPEVVVLMGATACSMLGDRINLDADHGIPFKGELYGWKGWIVPIYHPAIGLHDTSMMQPLLEDWSGLERWLEDGTWMWARKDESRKDYGILDSKVEAEEFLHQCYQRMLEPTLMGGDTESHDHEPYSWQLSPADGFARMIMLKNGDVCRTVAGWLAHQIKRRVTGLVFHHAPADLGIFEYELDMVLDGYYRDTMIEAYGFQNYKRLGLKILSKRLLGRDRRSWEEVVEPHSKEVLSQWMMAGMELAEREWTIREQRFHKKTNKPLKDRVVISSAEKMLVELHGYMAKSETYDIWSKIAERMSNVDLSNLNLRLGPLPVRGIAHVPLNEAIEYACSDADDTRQLAIMFDRMRKEFVDGLFIQDKDVDINYGELRTRQDGGQNYTHGVQYV